MWQIKQVSNTRSGIRLSIIVQKRPIQQFCIKHINSLNTYSENIKKYVFFWQLWWAAASIGRMCQNVKIAIYLQFTPQLSGQTNPATSSISSTTILVDTGRRNLKASEVVSLNTVQSISQRSVSKLGRDTEVAVTSTTCWGSLS